MRLHRTLRTTGAIHVRSTAMNNETLSVSERTFSRRAFMKTAALAGAAGALAQGPAVAQIPRDVREGSLRDPLSKPGAAKAGSVPLAPPDKQPANLRLPEPKTRKAGWAIVGLGELALGEVMPAFRECLHSRPVALVSGHPEKAKVVAEANQIDPRNIYTYENFDTLRDNPAVDVVYIVLPNSMHAEYTVRALRAGKHVLCEKPMATTISECEQMIAAAKKADRQLGVAYRLHYEPLNKAVMAMCREKKFGPIKLFSSANCQNTQAPNIRLSADLGGGPVGDVGIYSINAARYTIQEEPTEVLGMAHWGNEDPRFREVPESVSYLMRFPSGAMADCQCSFGTARSSRYRVLCTKGYIEMDPAFSYRGLKLRLAEQQSEQGSPTLREPAIEQVNQFAKQFDDFSQKVLAGQRPTTPGEEGLLDMRVVLAIHESIRTGSWVKV